MKKISLIVFTSLVLSCSNKLQVNVTQESVVELINKEHQRKLGIRKDSQFQIFDKLIYDLRKKAVRLYDIETDISDIERFIIIDLVSYEGGKSTFGEIVLNDTSKFFYKHNILTDEVEKHNNPVESEQIILTYLNEHRFSELKAIAIEKGKTLSGSNFFYIGMYEKGMDSVFVGVLPGFMEN